MYGEVYTFGSLLALDCTHIICGAPNFTSTCEVRVRLHETPLLVESNVLDYYYYNIDIHDNR